MNSHSVKPYLATSHGILYQGDCVDMMRSLEGESVDTVFADPPFNLGKDYGQGIDDTLSERSYLDWTDDWIAEAVRVLKPGGALFFYNIPKWCISVGESLTSRHSMEFRHWIAITMKNTYPRGKSLYPAHYGLLYYTKGAPRAFNKLRVPIPICRHCSGELRDYGGHRDRLNPRGLNLTDFWEDTSPVRHRKFKKRPSNELKLMIPERCILMSTNPDDLVLDPFGGGGSTYQVADLRHRRWIGSEIGECEPIRERLLDADIPVMDFPEPSLTPTQWLESIGSAHHACEVDRPGDEVGEAPLKNGSGSTGPRENPDQGSFL